MRKAYIVLMHMITIIIVAFSVFYMTREFTKVINLSNMGDMWSFLSLQENSPYAEFTEVDQEDFASPPIPEIGDMLVEIDGLPSTTENYFSVFNADTPAGREIDIKFIHDKEVYSTTVVTRSIPFDIQLQVWLVLILRTLIVIGLIVVGLWGLIKQPWSSSVRSLTLFCYTLAVGMNLTSPAISDSYAAYSIPVLLFTVFGIIQVFYPAFWLKLQILFPEKKSWYTRHWFLSNAVIFGPGVLIALLFVIWDLQLNIAVTILWTLQLTAGFIILFRNHRQADSFVSGRQTRLVMYGSAPGVILTLGFTWFIVLAPQFYTGLSFVIKMLITDTIFFFMLMIPLSLLYAFGKYKLLSVEAKVKRGTRYLAVSLILLILFLGILYLFGNLVLRQLGVESRTPTLILGLVLAFAFMPTQRKLRLKLEKHFYPERVRLRELLRNFLASNIVRTESSEFWKELEQKLAEGLAAEKIYPVLRVDNKDYFAVEMKEPAPFGKKDQIVRSLERSEYPILFDELMASGKIVLSPEQEDWFLQRNSAILLPLSTKSGLVGFLVISSKTNGEDFTAEELDMLAHFSAQTALVAENFELLNERLVKQKLEEQLKVARDIQKGLLPGEIPCRPGLEVDALIRFCLDVAGDYYDVIPMDHHRTVLSIGDVAGKGVGPAMLMANLQASLRTTQAMGVSLSESCRQINRIVCENTPDDLFITFFVVLIDTSSGTMRYVNCGHNPPMLVTSGGDVHMLSDGGVLLGVTESAEYREGMASLGPDDIVIMYTDGVCEAMNAAEEEFGERRLADLVVSNRKLPLENLLHLIHDSVKDHHGSDQYEDDFTLLSTRYVCDKNSAMFPDGKVSI